MHDVATLICLVLAIFAGVGIRWAVIQDRLDDAEHARHNSSEGTD